MKFTKELDLIKVLGWTQASKMIYMLRKLKEGMSRDELYSELIGGGVMKHKSFEQHWNRIERIGNDIKFIK